MVVLLFNFVTPNCRDLPASCSWDVRLMVPGMAVSVAGLDCAILVTRGGIDGRGIYMKSEAGKRGRIRSPLERTLFCE